MRILLIILTVVVFFTTGEASAKQSSLTFRNVEVDLWRNGVKGNFDMFGTKELFKESSDHSVNNLPEELMYPILKIEFGEGIAGKYL